MKAVIEWLEQERESLVAEDSVADDITSCEFKIQEQKEKLAKLKDRQSDHGDKLKQWDAALVLLREADKAADTAVAVEIAPSVGII